ncbi:GNAT family N-acetyltransferase [Caulobacter sp. 17J80-11]|uniref:GNAT family N-acetyltransferase n=1 Tax=Caulobacter sp. 17J80-11 TaxID=2763502 RepID=UPI00351CA3D9
MLGYAVSAMTSLTLRPIDLARDADLVIRFVREVFALSFDDDRFTREFGADGAGYLSWLEDRLAGDPAQANFALDGSEDVGLLVTGRFHGDPAVGYVYTYYLAPEARGRGLGEALDEHAMAALRARGYARARLSVAEKNLPAMRFYSRRGWAPVGPRPDQPGVIYMEKATGSGS